MSCPFCEIDSAKTRLLETTPKTMVIFSNPRLVPGHLLVIPKRHVEKLSELDIEEKNELFAALTKWQNKIAEKFASGCDIRQNYRPFLPQGRLKIDHLHFHLLPREFEDELYKKSMIHEREIFKDLREEEIEKILNIF